MVVIRDEKEKWENRFNKEPIWMVEVKGVYCRFQALFWGDRQKIVKGIGSLCQTKQFELFESIKINQAENCDGRD